MIISVCLTITVLTVAIFALVGEQYVSENPFGFFTINIEFHCIVEQYAPDGTFVSMTTHAMTIVNYGKDQIEQLLGDNSDLGLSYFCLSNNETAVSTAWTTLPDEITTGGLARAQAAYVSTGTGTWNMTYTWTCTVAQGVCLYGVCSNAGTSATLCLAEQQGSGARKNLDVGSTLKMTVQGTVS